MTVVRRLWVFSDLHQEWPANAWDPDPAANAPSRGFDVAVVAGDVHVPLTKSLDWLAERLTGVPVVYVPGNHDFWWDRGDERYTIHDQLERGRERVAAHGIHLLLDKAVAIGGTRFLCGTLWTDFRLGSFGLTHAFRSAQGRFGMYGLPEHPQRGRDPRQGEPLRCGIAERLAGRRRVPAPGYPPTGGYRGA